MTRRADYTSDEWALLTKSVETVGLGMLAVSNAGLIGRLRELHTLSRCLTRRALPIQFARNELVLALLEECNAQEQASGTVQKLSSDNVAGLVAAVVAAHVRMLSRCQRVAALLAAKSPLDEADGLKQWLVWIARCVAEASGDGWFGLGRKVTDEKASMLAEIATALQMSRVARIPTTAELDALLGPTSQGPCEVSSGGGHGSDGGPDR
ncbi:MAG TPA: hypothetical protein VJQ45_09615 [Ktedonobacterales bacterium]|nr:hypothetical protein [Ktedonobacterales bacterium]